MYFCAVKSIKIIILLCLVGLLPYESSAYNGGQLPEPTDSMEISLLTCTPGTEIWAQFGHTAVRWHDFTNGTDWAVNYGMFSSDQPFFIPRFIFGLTDYRMDVAPFDEFLAEYAYSGRGVIEQKLNLTAADKARITVALRKNILPENQVYRYNFFYDNCTTRARDVIVNNLGGSVNYPPAKTDSCSFRIMVHQWNKDYPWIQFGEDMLLGLGADAKTDKSEQQFLPDNLRADFDRTIYNGNPLVSSSQMIIAPQETVVAPTSLTPMDVIIMLFIVTVTLEIIEYRRHRLFWGIDLFYILLSGLAGIILFLMIFSQHPTVRLNLMILFINPLPLFVAYPAIKRTRMKRKFWWWTAWEILIILGMIGGFFQSYPSGMIILALLLLTRPLLHHNRDRELARTK